MRATSWWMHGGPRVRLAAIGALATVLVAGCQETARQVSEAPVVRDGNQPLVDLSNVDRPTIDVDPQPLFPPMGQPSPQQPTMVQNAPVTPVSAQPMRSPQPMRSVQPERVAVVPPAPVQALQTPAHQQTWPQTTAAPASNSESATQRYENARFLSHEVRSGDTIPKIAQSYGVREIDLIGQNGLDPNRPLYIGQIIMIPAGTTHVVSAGETYSDIAVRYNVDLRRLLSLNGISPPFRITPGQTLRIPTSG